MKFGFLLCTILILSVFTSACTSTSNILFMDDFTNKNNKWDQVTNNDMTTDYYESAYHIVVNQTNYDAWANPDDLNFTDVQVEVDATMNGGPNYNDFGIICRYKNPKSYYYGVIGSDGFFSIFKKTADGGVPLSPSIDQFSDKINTKASTNHIRFDCVGSTLTLYVNGTQIDQRTDSSYKDGNVGLIAGTYTEKGTDILFDNFFVYKP